MKHKYAMNLFEAIEQPNGMFKIPDVNIFDCGNVRGFDCNDKWAAETIKNFNAEQAEDGFKHLVHEGHNKTPSRDDAPALGFMENMRLGDRVKKGGEAVKSIFVDLVNLSKDVVDKVKALQLPNRSIEFRPKDRRILSLALGRFTSHFKQEPLTLSEKDIYFYTLDEHGEPIENSPDTSGAHNPERSEPGGKDGDRDGRHKPSSGSNGVNVMSEFQKLYEAEKTRAEKLETEKADVGAQLSGLETESVKLREENKSAKAEIEKLNEQIEEARTKAHKSEVEGYLASAKAKGRIGGGEDEHLLKLSETADGFESVKAMIDARKDGSMVPLEEIAAAAAKDEESDNKPLTEDNVLELAEAYRKENGCSLSQALEEVTKGTEFSINLDVVS